MPEVEPARFTSDEVETELWGAAPGVTLTRGGSPGGRRVGATAECSPLTRGSPRR